MAEPIVSAVMPVHNGASWIGAAIESVLNQTMSSFELIVVDNRSTDETPQIIAGYASRDPRVTTGFESTPGAAAARNNGVTRARGQWIASMDADDLARPTRFERQLALSATRNDFALIGSGFEEIDDAGKGLATYSYPSSDRRLRARLVRLQGFFPASSAFFNRGLALELGGYRPAVGYAEDWDLWLRLAAVGRIGCLPGALVAIRQHEGQVTRFQQGRPQAIHAVSATVAHFIRRSGAEDPIASSSGNCERFVSWVERRMDEYGYFDQRRSWQEARAKYLVSDDHRTLALARFGRDLLASGHGSALILQKLFGNDLARRLALEWTRGAR